MKTSLVVTGIAALFSASAWADQYCGIIREVHYGLGIETADGTTYELSAGVSAPESVRLQIANLNAMKKGLAAIGCIEGEARTGMDSQLLTPTEIKILSSAVEVRYVSLHLCGFLNKSQSEHSEQITLKDHEGTVWNVWTRNAQVEKELEKLSLKQPRLACVTATTAPSSTKSLQITQDGTSNKPALQFVK